MEQLKVEFPDRYDFHGDMDHSWLAVPFQLLVFLKIDHRISTASYRRRDTVYLEADLDFAIFIWAMQVYDNETYRPQSWTGGYNRIYDGYHSFIRKLPRYYR